MGPGARRPFWRAAMVVFAGALCIAAVSGVASPSDARAQGVGGLVKKAKDKVSPSSASSPGPAAPAGQKAAQIAITPDVLDRFVTALQAERAERDRLEKQHSGDGVGKLYVARDLVTRCDSMKRGDSAYQAGVVRKAQTGDTQAAMDAVKHMQQMQTEPLHMQCQNNRAPEEHDQAFFDMMRSVQARQDTVGAKAGGFGVAEYAALRERIGSYVLNPNRRKDFPGFAPSEISALDAKQTTLYQLLQRDYGIGGAPKQTYQL